MNRQARVLFNFISSSSSDDFLALQDTSAPRSYYQRLIYSLLSRSIYKAESFEYLGRQLAGIAQHAYFVKQIETIDQTSQVMLALPISREIKGVAHYYQAICAMRKGDIDGARKLLESVIEEAIPQYKARALLTIGAIYFERGEIDSALPFHVAAGKAAIDCDPLTLAQSQLMISVDRSIHGDHKQALKDLKQLFPLIRAVSKQYPTAYYNFLNSFAVELGEVGRIDEARNVCRITLASPFAAAYSNWLETRDEIEAKRADATPSIVAVSTKLEPKTQISHKAKPVRPVAFIRPAGECSFIQRSVAILPGQSLRTK